MPPVSHEHHRFEAPIEQSCGIDVRHRPFTSATYNPAMVSDDARTALCAEAILA